MTWGASFFYVLALEKGKSTKNRKLFGTLVLTATLLIALYHVAVISILHLSRVAAVLIIMAATYMTGLSGGSAAGVALGMTMDAAAGRSVFFTWIYGFAALISGVFHKTGKGVFACVYVAANATAALLGITNEGCVAGLFESFIASVLFFIIPDGFWMWLEEYLVQPKARTSYYVKKVRETAKHYVFEISYAFYEMYLSLMNATKRNLRENDEDSSSVFRFASETVCRKCRIRHICWEREYLSTRNALNDASGDMMKTGVLKAEKLPQYFSSRCIRLPEFLRAVNESLDALFLRRQFRDKLNENKGLVARQYAGITGVLRQIGGYMSAGPEFIPFKEDVFRKYAEAFGAVQEISAYQDPFGRLCLEVSGEVEPKSLEEKEAFVCGLSSLMGVSLRLPRQISDELGTRVLIREKERYKADMGVGMCKKEHETVSGDNAECFVTKNGKAYMLLSDGMGSGQAACQDSRTAVKMLERFLRADIAPLDAMKTVGPAIQMRNDEVSFVTMDILELDLFSGECQIIKCGAAPSYYIRQEDIRCIRSLSLPVGILYGEEEQDVFRAAAKPGDMVILATDGVLCDEKELLELTEGFAKQSAREIASKIVLAAKDKGREDDMTVVVMRIEKNG